MKKVVFLGVLLLTACSSQFASNDKDQYLKSKNGPDLVVPPPLTSSNLSSFYVLPAQTQNAQMDAIPPQG